jgi:hypothetical protein
VKYEYVRFVISDAQLQVRHPYGFRGVFQANRNQITNGLIGEYEEFSIYFSLARCAGSI